MCRPVPQSARARLRQSWSFLAYRTPRAARPRGCGTQFFGQAPDGAARAQAGWRLTRARHAALDRIGRVVVARGRRMTGRHHVVDEGLVLTGELEIERFQVV